jgi:predicted transposase YdaD
VVKLELQMHAKPGFKHRLGAQTLRFLQLHPKVRHLQLVMDEVIWISLEELGQQAELQHNSQQILMRRPDLTPAVVPILMQRLPTFSLEQIMVVVNIPTHALRHSRAAQELLAEGRQQGEAVGEAKATLRLLNHRCGPLSPATTARIQALPLERLEAYA